MPCFPKNSRIMFAQLVGLLLVGTSGCAASGHADAKLSSRVSLEGPNHRGEIDRVKALDAVDADEQTQSPGDYALLGARHDLALTLKGNPSCGCVRVALGQPGDAAFSWDSAPPTINAATQLVFAMSSDGVECSGQPEGSQGASYEGYVLDGADVVVRLEGAREGPPVTSGAIIPRPKAGAAVYVKPYKEGLPYGSALDGKGPCRVWSGSPKSDRCPMELASSACGHSVPPTPGERSH